MVVVVVVVMMPASEVSLLSVSATVDALPPPVLALLSCPWVLVLGSPGVFALRVMVVLLSLVLSVRWLLYLVMSRAVVRLAALLNLPLAVTVVLVNLVIVYLVMIRVVNLVVGVVEVL